MKDSILENVIELQVEQGTERLDRWLSSQLADLSRSRLQKLIDQGQVQINGQVCGEKQHKIQNGDRVVVTIPVVQPLEIQAENIPLDILYEDSSLIIINNDIFYLLYKTDKYLFVCYSIS